MPNHQPPTITQQENDEFIKKINPDKVIETMMPIIEQSQMKSLANERASREPLPTIMNDAFDGENEIIVKTSAGNIAIRKMVALDVTIFKLTDSPFYKLMMGDIKETPNNNDENSFRALFPDEELLFALVYQFTHDPIQIRRAIKKDKIAYQDKVIEEVGGKYQPSDILTLVEAIINHVGMVNKGRVEFDAATEETPPLEMPKEVEFTTEEHGGQQDDKKKLS